VGVADLPSEPPALRVQRGEGPQAAEKLLEDVFRTRDAATWGRLLAAAGVPAEAVLLEARSDFASRIFDDPVNRQLGRVVTFPWGSHGRTDQPALAFRLGPEPRTPAPGLIAALGEHTDEVLGEIGIEADTIAELRRAGTISAAG
jgi:formyl-CoA transferase